MITLTPMTLGEYITGELDARGWDIARLAKELDVSWQRAQRLARDEPKRADGSPPDARPGTIKKVASAFRVSPKTVMEQVYLPDSNESKDEIIEDEEELLKYYRAVSDTMRTHVKAILKIVNDVPLAIPAKSESSPAPLQSASTEEYRWIMETRTLYTLEGTPVENPEIIRKFEASVRSMRIQRNIDETLNEEAEFEANNPSDSNMPQV